MNILVSLTVLIVLGIFIAAGVGILMQVIEKFAFDPEVERYYNR